MNNIVIYVVCRSAARKLAWQARSLHYDNVEFRLIVGSNSYYAIINDVLLDSGNIAMIIHDDVWLGVDINFYIADLIVDLDLKYPNWGLCGNVGMRWDGSVSTRHISDPHGGPNPMQGPRAVTSIDGNMMLLNCENMRNKGLSQIPDLGGFHGYDLVLSYEVLRRELTVIVDSRLYGKHDSGGNQAEFDEFASSERLHEYLSSHFSDYRFDTLNGPVVITEKTFLPVDINLKTEKSKAKALIDYYDTSLACARVELPVKLAICVRTQLKRPHLLERFMISAANAIRQSDALIATEIVLMTDQSHRELEAVKSKLCERFPDIAVKAHVHKITPGRSSRVDLAFQAFTSVEADFLWFVDDDDYLLPDGIRSIGRTISGNNDQLVVTDCIRATEVWEFDGHSEVLKSSSYLGRTNSSQIYEALRGDNFTPMCAIIYPRVTVAEKLKIVRGRTAYYEDYLLLLVALSCPGIAVEKLSHPCCGISVRGVDNTVTEKDRTIWNISVATVLSEIQATRGLAIHTAWDAVNHMRERQIIELQRAAAIRRLGNVANNAVYVGDQVFKITNSMDIHGFIDAVSIEDGDLLLSGWAADLKLSGPVHQIIVADGDNVVACLATHIVRPDVSAELAIPMGSDVGFRFRISSSSGWDLATTPQVFALSKDQAKKLKLSSKTADKSFSQASLYSNKTISIENFDEEYYLKNYPDVFAAIQDKSIESGFDHWLQSGFEEGRDFRFSNGLKPDRNEVALIKNKYRKDRLPLNRRSFRLDKSLTASNFKFPLLAKVLEQLRKR